MKIFLAKKNSFDDSTELLLETPNVSEDTFYENAILLINGKKYRPVCLRLRKEKALEVSEITEDDVLVIGNETLQEDEPTCPNCGYKIPDAFELPEEPDENDPQICGNCNAQLLITRVISVTYNTVLKSTAKVIDLDKE